MKFSKLLISCALISTMFTPCAAFANNYTINIDNQGQLTDTDNEFLNSLNKLQPGDEVSGTLEVVNNSNVKKQFVLVSEPEGEDKTNLLDNLKFVVKGQDVDFKGDLNTLNNDVQTIDLKTIDSGKSQKYDISVKLPENIGNEQSNVQSGVKWTIGATDIVNVNDNGASLAQTGDINNLILPCVLVTLSIICFAIAFVSKRKQDK